MIKTKWYLITLLFCSVAFDGCDKKSPLPKSKNADNHLRTPGKITNARQTFLIAIVQKKM